MHLVKHFRKLNVVCNGWIKPHRWFTSAPKNVPGVKLAYNIYDSENTENNVPPLIIMHGLFGSKQNWRSIGKAIEAKTKPRRRIITVDARNHGDSPHTDEHSYAHLAEDIRLLMKDLNISNASVLGHSMGGRAIMYFSLAYPHLVERTIVVDISPVASPANLLEIKVIFSAMKTINVSPELTMKDGRQTVENYLKQTINDKATIDFILLNLKKNEDGSFSWRPNIDCLHTNFDNITNFPEDVKNRQHHGDVLFIAGSKSDYLKEEQFPKIKEIFPSASLEWLDTGHLVHLEKPAEFLNLVLNFLNRN